MPEPIEFVEIMTFEGSVTQVGIVDVEMVKDTMSNVIAHYMERRFEDEEVTHGTI
jgi:hypothetical protein